MWSVLNSLSDEIYTTDYVIHDPGLPDLRRALMAKELVRGVFASLSDVSATVEDLVNELGDCRPTSAP